MHELIIELFNKCKLKCLDRAMGVSTNYLGAIERSVVQGYPVSIVWSVAKILESKAEDLLKE